MSKSAQNCHHLQAAMPCTASWWLLQLRGCICPVLPHWYFPLLSWNHQWTPAWILKLGVWPIPTRKSWRLQSGECRGQETSNSHKITHAPLSKFRLVKDPWAFVPSCCQTLTWLMTDELLPALPDDDQIIKGISDINADLPASSTIHFTPIPFPSISQTNSCHYWAKHASLSLGFYGT